MRDGMSSRRRRPRAGLTVERLEQRQLLAGDLYPRHNHFEPTDVDDDGDLAPRDVLLVVNELNRADKGKSSDFVDVNADGFCTSADVLMVINRLNLGKADRGSGPDTMPLGEDSVRSIDGSGNNLESPELGSAGERLRRLAPADYADGIEAPGGADRPSARAISNAVSDHGPDRLLNARNLSSFVFVWGQFLDHDIDLTLADNGDAFDVPVPAGDAYFDPAGSGDRTISLQRSHYDEATPATAEQPREQLNSITTWIDGSMIYGSDDETAAKLRAFENGRLLSAAGDMMPEDDEGSFMAGDIRAAENIALSSMHALFLREHNYWADRIATKLDHLDDEAIFQRARAIVIAEIQAITYNEFLPALLGRGALAPYQGYDPDVDPSIANEFSTAAFRFGHSTINEHIHFIGDDGRPVRDPVALRRAFFNPDLVRETGIDAILKYAASSQAEEIDLKVIDSLRNFLFGAPGHGGMDLVALNIQRGRDHGLADYNSVRAAIGLSRVTSFDEITSDAALSAALAETYGTVDNIDLWVGGLAEDHVSGGSLGPTFRRIIADQFERLRDADRFWYQTQFKGDGLRRLERTRLSDIIERNSDAKHLQRNVFFFRARVQGHVFDDTGGRFSAGLPVELLDTDGAVVATTVTDARGRYRFHTIHQTGDYLIRVPVSVEHGLAVEMQRAILISRSNEFLRHQDLHADPLDTLALDLATLATG